MIAGRKHPSSTKVKIDIAVVRWAITFTRFVARISARSKDYMLANASVAIICLNFALTSVRMSGSTSS